MDIEDLAPSEHFPIVDSLDHTILMHRDAHFGGKFSIMLDYYKKEGKGVQPEISIERIERLHLLEEQLKQNLAALFLVSNEMEKVAEAIQAYQKLREIYEVKKPRSIHPQLIADLILSEEEEPAKEMEAIIAEKGLIVQSLINLLRNEDFYDPLFPGYGQSPFLAAQCLGAIGDKRAIISLFEEIGHGDFFDDEQIIQALKTIGQPARDFLLRVVSGRPLNEDNEKAAIALIAFKDDEEVANHCFALLAEDDVQDDPCLPTYLVLACEGLKDPGKREAFQKMSDTPRLDKQLREDMHAIIHLWKDENL